MSIGELILLQTIDLRKNPLKDLPDSLGNLKNIQNIWFDEDQMSTKFALILQKIYSS